MNISFALTRVVLEEELLAVLAVLGIQTIDNQHLLKERVGGFGVVSRDVLPISVETDLCETRRGFRDFLVMLFRATLVVDD